MTPEQLDAIWARVAGATAGPWRTFPATATAKNPNDCAFGPRDVQPSHNVLPMIGECWAETVRGVQDRAQAHANAEFIAHARTDVEALVGEVERQRAVVDAAMKWWALDRGDSSDATTDAEDALAQAVGDYVVNLP